MADEQLHIVIYTDGAFSKRLRDGKPIAGWGVLIRFGADVMEMAGALPYDDATSQRGELAAVSEALARIRPQSRWRPTNLFSDSKYAVGAYTHFGAAWMRNGWRNATGAPAKNRDLIEPGLLVARTYRDLNVRWVKGHAGNPGNERADALARFGIDTFLDTGQLRIEGPKLPCGEFAGVC